MRTDIYFAGENVRVTVDDEPGQVAEAFTSAHGLPPPDGRRRSPRRVRELLDGGILARFGTMGELGELDQCLAEA